MEAHIPVMVEQVIDGLNIRPEGTYWDGTFGGGGHAREILARLGPKGKLIASDRDGDVAAAAQACGEDTRFQFIRGEIEEAVDQTPGGLAGFLWDLGCSTPQLKNPARGFSFKEDGPLDMRMDRRQSLTAATLVNRTGEKDLADLIYRYGEERLSRRIARAIVKRRERARIADTSELAAICRGAYPRRGYHRIDPATRTFQALRIAVNDELGQLERALPRALAKLGAGGRGVVISFHSLEDRVVKRCFREHAQSGSYLIMTKKPLTATEAERESNPASRSAKLRIIERQEGDGK